MKEIVIESLKRIRGLFNLYAAMLGMLAIGFVVKYMNSVFGFRQEPIKVFAYVIHEEYFSLVYGLLFAVFIVLLFLRLRLLKVALATCKAEGVDPFDELSVAARHFPWIASPLQRGAVGPSLFWFLLAVGFALLAEVTFSHLFGSPKQGSRGAFVCIGYVDLLVLVGCLALVGVMVRYVRSMKERLCEIDRWAAEQQGRGDADDRAPHP